MPDYEPPQPIGEPIGYKGGHKFTRKEWERNHKPTCKFYPCAAWKDIHWHISDMHILDVVRPSTKELIFKKREAL